MPAGKVADSVRATIGNRHGRKLQMLHKWTHAVGLLVILTVPFAWRSSWASAPVDSRPRTAPVLSGCEPDYPPYSIVTPDQQADGFSVELMRAALKAVGREVSFTIGSWPVIKQDLAEGRIDALPLVGRTPEREAIYDFTFPYLTMHGAIVVREDNTDIHGPADLRGKQVAVLQGDNAEEYLRRANLGAVIVPLPSFETALRELSGGKYDAVVIQKLLAFQLMHQTGIANLRVEGPPLKDFTQTFCFAVRKGNSAILAQLNEGLAIAMADGTFRRLHAKWFSALEAMSLTKSRIVVGGDANYPPYEFLDANGQPAGFNVDLTKAIARRMGLSVEIRLGPWGEVRKGLESGNIDLVQGMFYSVERDKAFAFSPPYAQVQHAIVVRKGSPELSSMAGLKGKSILVMAGDIMHDLAVEKGYAKQIVAVASQEEALRRLAAGEGDCALVAEVPALYWIEKHGWRNLRICAPPVLSAQDCYAFPRGEENLLPRFSEGLAAVKRSGEFRKIQSRWLAPYEPSGLSLLAVAKIGLAVILPLIALLAGSFLWSRSLRRQVTTRTRELSAEVGERKIREEALRQSEEKYRSILDNIEESYFEVDLAGNLTFFNESLCLLLGYPGDELMGMNNRQYTDLEQAKVLFGAFNEVYKTGAPALGFDWEVIRQDGTKRTIEASASLKRGSGGEPVGFRGILRDITDRKAGENALREAEEHYRTLVENLGEGVGIVDSTETFFFANPTGEAIFGVAPGGLAGRNLREFLSAGEFEHAEESTRQRLKGLAGTYETRITRPDGQVRDLKVTATPMRDSEGAYAATLAVFSDVTDQKRAEQVLRLSELEREKAKGSELLAQLLQGLAHEIRNPLFAIDVNAAVLEKKASSLPDVAQHIKFVKEHVGRLDNLMRDLMELGHQPTAGERIECRLRDVVSAAVMAAESQNPEVSGRTLVEAPEIPVAVRAVPDRLHGVFVHIIDNALQNSPPGGRVVIRVGRSDGTASVAVSDEGQGIPEKIRERLFEPFVTTHPGRRGLGLALAKHYMTAMGGTLEAANNDPGPGATFTVRLPLGE